MNRSTIEGDIARKVFNALDKNKDGKVNSNDLRNNCIALYALNSTI